MRKTTLFALLLAPVLWAGLASGLCASDKPIPVPNSWIVELVAEPTLQFRGEDNNLRLQSDGSARARTLAPTAPEVTGIGRFDVNAPAVQDYAALLDQERNMVLAAAARRLGRELEPKAVYRHVLNGFAVNMSAAEAAEVARLPGVASVTQDMAYRPHLDEGPKRIGADVLWSGDSTTGTRGEGVVIGVIDSGINWDHIYFTDDPAQSDGHTYTNPLGSQLGECSKSSVPCNDKLIGVWNFADEGTNGKDPDEIGHGTHVSSIAAGNPWRFSLEDIEDHQFNTSGVAPRANIVSYKVCWQDHPDDDDLDGRCESSLIDQALEQVVEDGVDIVNYSIGSEAVNPWSSNRLNSFLNIRSAGILVTSSAGNSGPAPGTVDNPANAPWVMGIASTTHKRRVGQKARVASVFNILVQPGTGPEASSDISASVIAADEISESLLACEPFDPGAFSGAIAFVRRGECTFEAKVTHAENAGAVAVLVYNNVGGLPPTMAGLEDTGIPSAMMDRDQGELALNSIRSSSDPIATLFADRTAILNSDWEDRVSPFSARGPANHTPGIMKPNAAAPGESILGGFVPDENSLAFLSGTSMASPHVAGAAALLKARHPGWGPAELQSALETTAETAPVNVEGDPATILDRGAGRIRVDLAAEIGLYLPVSTSDFENADPAGGGNPADLNLPGVFSENCAGTCEFTRTVRALRNGEWSVATDGSLAIDVTPESFDLSQGQSQQLSISVDVRELPLSAVFDGSIVMTPNNTDMSVQRLPVGVISSIGDLPEELDISATASRGSTTLNLEDIAPIPEAEFRTSSLVRPDRETFNLPEDGSSDDPYDGGSGVRTFLIEVPADALMLFAETVASAAKDIDLFVGFDGNGNDEADESEAICSSTSPNELEQCIVERPEEGTWWILVQNWDASSPSSLDSVDLDLALLTSDDDPSLVVSGPGRHEGGDLSLALFWDQPAMRRGQTWLGAIAFSSSPDELGDGGIVPVNITRTSDEPVLSTALFDGETLPVVVAGSTTHDRLFFDVPASASRVGVAVSGDSGVSVVLKRIDFDAIAGSAPDTPPASGAVLASGADSGSGIDLSVDAQAGRWYVVLENSNATEARVHVGVDLAETAPNSARRGLWSPDDRSIFQGIEWQESGGTEFIVWYTYEAGGLPMFYNAIAAPRENSSVWTADVLRTTSIGTRNNIDTIGRISLTQLGEDEMIVAWRLNGAHGSERFGPDAAQSCPEVDGTPVSYTGHWNSPGVSQGGTTMIVTDSSQAQVRYYFDQSGTGRWVITTSRDGDGPLAEELDVLELRGFCPTCEDTGVTIETIGSYARVFGSESSGSEIVDITAGPPLNQDFVTEVPITKLSSRMECN